MSLGIGPYESIKPMCGVARRIMVILWDPHDPDWPSRPSRDDVEQAVFGSKNSVATYFLENSGGKFTIVSAGVYGWYEAEQPNEWYLKGNHDRMGAALRAANADVDFSQFGHGRLDPDKLCIIYAHPGGNPPDGLGHNDARPIQDVNGGDLVLDGLKIRDGIELGAGLPNNINIGVFAHEIGNLLLGLGELYNRDFFFSTKAGPYSVMANHERGAHIDPFEKMKLGWIDVRRVEGTGRYGLRDIETHHEAIALVDPKHGTDEYILVENRWRGDSFDASLPDQGFGVWHIMEDRKDYANAPPPPFTDPVPWANLKAAWSVSAIRMIRPVITPSDPLTNIDKDDGPAFDRALWDGSDPLTGYHLLSDDPDSSHPSLRWGDGTPSGFEVEFGPAQPDAHIVVRVGNEVWPVTEASIVPSLVCLL